MFIALILIFSAMWGLLYYTYREVFAPWSITLLVWVFIISMYVFLDHGLYDSGPQFVKGILIWNVGFCACSYLSFRLTPAYKGPKWVVNGQTVNIIKWLCVLVVPFMTYKAVTFALSNGTMADLVFNLRDQTINDTGFSLGPLIYFVHVVYALLLVTADAEKINYKQLALALVLSLSFFVMTMSKQTFFMIVVSVLYLFYVHKRISLKPFFFFGVAFVILGILFTNFRTTRGDGGSNFEFMDLLAMYVVSPIVAFCYDAPESAAMWGENTFRGFYSLMNGLGMGNYQTQIFQSFIYVPIPTNVYTMMSPYFKDFGYAGIGVFSCIEGLFIGAVYKLSETGHNVLRLIYTYILTMLVLQFFDELFFVGLSNFLQITAVILLCHVKFVYTREGSKSGAPGMKLMEQR